MANLLRYCVFGLLLVPALSFAQRTIVVEPGQVTRMYEPGQGSHAYFDSRNWNQPVSTQQGTINVPVKASRGLSWANFRARAASILKLNPSSVAGGAAVTAALAAVDWLLDPDNNTIKKPGDPQSAPTSDYAWRVFDDNPGGYNSVYGGDLSKSNYQGPVYSNPTETCVALGEWLTSNSSNNTIFTFNSASLVSTGNYQCRITAFRPSDGYTSTSNRGRARLLGGSSCPSGYVLVGGACLSEQSQYVPVLPSDIDNFVAGWSDPALPLELAPSLQVPPDAFDPDVFSGPASMPGPTSSTTTTTPSGDTIVSQDSITYDFSYSNNPLSITTNTTTVNNTYQNGVQTSTSTTTTNNTNTNPDSNVQLPDIPTDCEFMPTVCEWLDWTKEDLNEPDPDLSGLLNDEDFDRDFSIPLNATCPAPYPINTQLFGTVYFQWEPLCLFAEYIRYLVISGAILFAMYISLGIQRKG